MGLPDLPTMSSPPPPPNLAQSIAASADATRKRKMQSSLGLSKYFNMLNTNSGGGGANTPPIPANQAPKVLLGQ